MPGNLIPNADFSSGLQDWECTPSGTSLVETAGKRFVMLAGQKSPAAICSDPVEVVPNAAYKLWVEKAVRGDATLSMISRSGVVSPDGAEEVVPTETPVRVQVTSAAGKRAGIARVVLEPVGRRLKLESLRTTALFATPGEPFVIFCGVRNTGSEAVSDGTVELRGEHLIMLEEFRYPVPVPPLAVGESALIKWEVITQRRAVAQFAIELLYDNQSATISGSTLKHKPRDLDKPSQQNVAGGRRWFSVGPSATRVVAHETDLGFGPLLVTSPLDKAVLGVLHQPAQLVLGSGQIIPLFAEMKKVSARGIELSGLEMASFEFGPFQTESMMVLKNGVANVISQSGQIPLTWQATIKNALEVSGSSDAGLLIARTKAQLYLPGVQYRAAAALCRVSAAIMRSA
jgi:hypothetical protein